MKNSLFKSRAQLGVLCGMLLLTPSVGFVSCTEQIDDSNFAIKKEQTATDFLNENPEFSLVTAIFQKVKMGMSNNSSSIYSVLSARGNYTVFLPDNAAIRAFLAENEVTDIEQLNEEKLALIAKSCIIDNGNDKAYESAEFPTSGTFNLPNLNNRLLGCKLNKDSKYVINESSLIVDEDIEVSNGYLHIVDKVIAPSAKTLDKQIAEAGNMKVFGYLLEKTTWADSLHENLDISYEDPDRPLIWQMPRIAPFTWAQHRYIGYTALVEPDSIYAQELGVDVNYDEEGNLTNGDQILAKLKEKTDVVYGDEQTGAAADDYSHPDNSVNRYVAYHLIQGKVPFNKLVLHYNEFGYKCGESKHPQQTNLPINVWSFYTTMGQHPGLVKITQVGDFGFEQDKEHNIYANRISTYADGPEDDYHETGVYDGMYGNKLSPYNQGFDNNSLNGYYYPINSLLFYSEKVRNEIAKRRIRIDLSTMLPEMQSNGFRGEIYIRFENGYFDNIINSSEGTAFCYLRPQGHLGWASYQGDEFMASGLYDLTLRLPPVPKDGTYEIRYGTSHNPYRGMCQIYFGDEPNKLMPAGLPYDLRQGFNSKNSGIPWVQDGDDWTVNAEVDKNMRNQGYLKGPRYYTSDNGQGDNDVRRHPNILRRIILVADMKANKTYYLRFKSALKKLDSELTMDYFELANTSVYNGPTPEDIW